MFFDTNPTPFDVRFRLFGIPIRVHPSFWLISFLLLYNLAAISLLAAGVVLAVFFFSLLCHELAHSLMFRRYRIYSSIVLYCFGGLARPDYSPPRYTQRIAVALAGPIANFLIIAATWGSDQLTAWSFSSPYAMIAYEYLIALNLFLGIFNLLPIWPFDGGQVSMELWVRARPRDGAIQALRMSLVCAVVLIAYSLITHFRLIPELDGLFFGMRPPGVFLIIILAMLAFANYQQLQLLTGRKSYYDDDRPPWRR